MIYPLKHFATSMVSKKCLAAAGPKNILLYIKMGYRYVKINLGLETI